MFFAVLKDNLVDNIISADSKEVAENVTGSTCVEISDIISVAIGYIYDITNGEFLKPGPVDLSQE